MARHVFNSAAHPRFRGVLPVRWSRNAGSAGGGEGRSERCRDDEVGWFRELERGQPVVVPELGPHSLCLFIPSLAFLLEDGEEALVLGHHQVPEGGVGMGTSRPKGEELSLPLAIRAELGGVEQKAL